VRQAVRKPVFLVFSDGEPLGVMTMEAALRWAWGRPDGRGAVLDFVTRLDRGTDTEG